MQNLLRNIPSVTELLENPTLKQLSDNVSRNVVVSGVRQFLGDLRDEVQNATSDIHVPDSGELAENIARWIVKEQKSSLRSVVNATGILLHTGLGRAPLAREAVEEISAISCGYASVELDLDTGERSQRIAAVEKLLCKITGAEAAAVTNNNAGATMLVLAALGAGREVIVSRGQLVEIGGSYRLPDVMTTSGAIMREIGTTNKTRVTDYENGINENTAALMRVHTSNFKVVGFTAEASLAELVTLGRQRNLPVIDDIGSGALVDFAQFGLQGEPLAADSVKAGADLVLFSGDKLLGGPQCGIIVGKKEQVAKVIKHPMMRALRVDKITLAALAATLRLYQDEETALQSVPLLSLLNTSVENLELRANRLAPQLAAMNAIGQADAVADETYLGGGSIPAQQIATWCVAVTPASGKVDRLARRLREGTPSVVGRVHQDRLMIDLRSVTPAEEAIIKQAVSQLSSTNEPDQANANEDATEQDSTSE